MVNDLSTFHQPVTRLFESFFSPKTWDQFRLSDDQVEFFRQNGYVAGVRVLSDAQINEIRGELADVSSQDHEGRQWWYEYNSNESTDPDKTLFHALGGWRIKPGLHDMLWNPAFLVPASQLLGGSVRFWHDQLFCKPARHGGVVAWHQDYSYWTRTEPMEHLTCWIGLDPSTIENGCLQYIPGSHRWELLPITGLAGDMDAIKVALDEEQWEMFQNPVAIEMEAGQCAFHHPLLVHGSKENNSSIARRACVLNVLRDGVCSASDEPLLAGIEPTPKGEKLGGQFFPLLYDIDS